MRTSESADGHPRALIHPGTPLVPLRSPLFHTEAARINCNIRIFITSRDRGRKFTCDCDETQTSKSHTEPLHFFFPQLLSLISLRLVLHLLQGPPVDYLLVTHSLVYNDRSRPRLSLCCKSVNKVAYDHSSYCVVSHPPSPRHDHLVLAGAALKYQSSIYLTCIYAPHSLLITTPHDLIPGHDGEFCQSRNRANLPTFRPLWL